MLDRTRNGRLTLREERAEVTRRRIVQAAEELFASDGYGATTLKVIAARAGVAVQTVYAVYGSKAGILDALREGVMHDPEAESLYRSALEEPDAARRLELFARSIRTRWEHGATIVVILQAAATTDTTIRAGVERALARRRAGMEQLAAATASDLAAGSGPAQAAAILDALTVPELWTLLVRDHGWTPDAYEAWLARSLRQQLLGAGPGALDISGR